MSTLSELAATNTDLLWAAVVSAAVSAGISYWFKRREIRHSAEVDYEYEQRKKLRDLIGRYHGRLLNSSNNMNYRMLNLYKNFKNNWLNIEKKYSSEGNYYFNSSVYRFMIVCSLVDQVESESLLLDVRIAKKDDFTFLNYVAAFHWVMTDTALFNGMCYDNSQQIDHFFSDNLRRYCDACLQDNDFVRSEDFDGLLKTDSPISGVLHYFDGLTRDEPRFRWDRLVAFHLLIMAFINTFGYKRQHSDQRNFVDVANQIRNPEVLKNLVAWLPKLDLGNDREAKKIAFAAQLIKNS